jgi:hypothetical protein
MALIVLLILCHGSNCKPIFPFHAHRIRPARAMEGHWCLDLLDH